MALLHSAPDAFYMCKDYYEPKGIEVTMQTKTKSTSETAREVRALQSAPLESDTAPTRVKLAPWGQVESSNGSFVVDEEGANLAVEAFREHGTDLPIDYEHQTLGGSYSSPTGQAPAAGWIKQLTVEPGVGLFVQIEWTPQAREMLASKQYRYLSPVAIIRKTDRKLVAIHSAALTNKPAIVGMQPIVNRDGDFLFTSTGPQPLDQLRAELNLPCDTDVEEVLVAASERLSALQADAKHRHAERRIRDAMAAGKLVEAQRAWAEALVAREEGLFDEWLLTAPIIVRPGATVPPRSHNASEQRRRVAVARARAEFRSNRLLRGITTEEAFVADALRNADL